MFGKNPRLNPLETRKQILIAESELNRAQLAGDLAGVAAKVRTLANRAKSIGSVAATAAALMAGLAAFQRGQSADSTAKPSWWQSLLNGARLISTVWLAFQSPGSKATDK